MTRQTRRGFLLQASLGSVVLTTVAACASAPTGPETPMSTQPDLSSLDLSSPLVAYIGNIESGEIVLMSGLQEFTYQDPEFVQRLKNAIGQ